jgi:hypothetical protein
MSMMQKQQLNRMAISMRKKIIKILLILITNIVSLIAGVYLGVNKSNFISDYRPRAQFAKRLAAMENVKTKIEKNIVNNKHIEGSGVNVVLSDMQDAQLSFFKVTNDGILIFQTINEDQMVALLPAYDGSNVIWSCVGSPKQKLPLICQDNVDPK